MFTRARAAALLAGIALALLVMPLLDYLVGHDPRLVWPATCAAYATAGAAFGIAAPRDGWRLGPFLSACWYALLPAACLLAGELPVDVRAELRELAGHALVLVAASLGAEAGAIFGRRQRAAAGD
jgi:hypothetical protein